MDMRKTLFTTLGVIGMTAGALAQKVSEVKFVSLDTKKGGPVLTMLRGNDTLEAKMIMFDNDINKEHLTNSSPRQDLENREDASYSLYGSTKGDTIINGKQFSKLWLDSHANYYFNDAAQKSFGGKEVAPETIEARAKQAAHEMLNSKKPLDLNLEAGRTSNFVWVPTDKLVQMFDYNKEDASFGPGKMVPVKLAVKTKSTP